MRILILTALGYNRGVKRVGTFLKGRKVCNEDMYPIKKSSKYLDTYLDLHYRVIFLQHL